MRQYYYTVASLPSIKLEDSPFYTSAQFLEVCSVELTPEDLPYVAGASITPAVPDEPPGGGNPLHQPDDLLGLWAAWQREFTLLLAHQRAQALSWDAERMPRSDLSDPSIIESVRRVLAEDGPLRRELAVMETYWNEVTMLAVGHHFDRDALAAYHLKLQIAARRARMLADGAGKDEYERQYEYVGRSLMEIAR